MNSASLTNTIHYFKKIFHIKYLSVREKPSGNIVRKIRRSRLKLLLGEWTAIVVKIYKRNKTIKWAINNQQYKPQPKFRIVGNYLFRINW